MYDLVYCKAAGGALEPDSSRDDQKEHQLQESVRGERNVLWKGGENYAPVEKVKCVDVNGVIVEEIGLVDPSQYHWQYFLQVERELAEQ